MARRLVCCLVLLALVAVAPAAGALSDRKQSVDERLSDMQAKLAQAQERESALSAEIASVSQEIQSLESQVGDVSSRLAVLEDDLALHKRKLDAITELYEIQSERLSFLRRQYDVSVQRLSDRMVAIYEGGEPSTLDVLIDTHSFTEVLDQLDYVESIASEDRSIVKHVTGARDHMRELKTRTGKTKQRVAAVTRVVQIRTDQTRALRDQLVSRQTSLSSARRQKRGSLAEAHSDAAQFAGEAAALQAQSANLAAQIRSAQSAAAAAAAPTYSTTAGSTPSASGLIWPVNGPVVSPFGWRWGRMHEGIDIGAGYGTPIVAAASGTVIYAGWMGGYGNLIIIDHGGGLATAYGHQSSFAVGGGAVSQGQVIGYVGCTGHCFGPHVHFEVRVNGSPVDPLGYL